MPYIIVKNKKNVDEENAFYLKTGDAGFIPVVCTIKRRYADIYADVQALGGGEHREVRLALMYDPHALAEIVKNVFERFNPKVKSWSFGYYSSIQGIEADIAQEMSAMLSDELDAFIMRFRKSFEAR